MQLINTKYKHRLQNNLTFIKAAIKSWQHTDTAADAYTQIHSYRYLCESEFEMGN